MKKYIFGCLAVLIIIVVFFLYNLPEEKTLSTEEKVLQTIIETHPVFSHEDKPVIEIKSLSQHEDGWYVATIKSSRPVKSYIPVRFVLRDIGGEMKIIFGPEIFFSENEMLSLNVPDSAILELQKE